MIGAAGLRPARVLDFCFPEDEGLGGGAEDGVVVLAGGWARAVWQRDEQLAAIGDCGWGLVLMLVAGHPARGGVEAAKPFGEPIRI